MAKLTDQEFEHTTRKSGCTPATLKNTSWLAMLGWLRWAYDLGYEHGQNSESVSPKTESIDDISYPCPYNDKLCPVCGLELIPCSSGWSCSNGHGF